MARPPRLDMDPFITTLDCSREGFLRERRERMAQEKEIVQCHKKRTLPGYEKLMSAKMNLQGTED